MAVTTAALLGVSAPSASAQPAGLVLGYGFERISGGAAADSSPSGIAGVLRGAPGLPAQTASVKGHGKALAFFSAQHQFVDAGDAPALDVDRFTLAAWVRITPNVHDTRWEIMEKPGAYWMNVRTDTRRLRVGGFFGGCVTSNHWFYLDSTKVLPVNTWVHVAGTYDGSTLRIFVNGYASGKLTVRGHTCVNSWPLGIGAKNRTETGVVEAYFDGRIDDLRVYNRALTAAQVRAVRAAALR